MGDTPYSQAQANLLDAMIERMNAEPLAFVVHIGDITSGSGPCSDAWLEARKRQFARFSHPFVLLPGDNEWTDCHRGGFDPLERLAKWRSLFCTEVPGLALERQPGEYYENLRWQAGGAQEIFVLMQADPQFEHGRARDGYARLRAVLATEARWFAGRLVLVHGDSHRYRDDEPLPGLRRIEVPGAPDVRWLRTRLAAGRLEVAPAAP